VRSTFRRDDKPKAEKTAGGQLLELVVIVAVALGLALGIQAFLVKPYRIPSESMVPTLTVGQRVLVNRIGNDFNDPHIGEILVFHPPKSQAQNGDTSAAVCADYPHGLRDGYHAIAGLPRPNTGSGQALEPAYLTKVDGAVRAALRNRDYADSIINRVVAAIRRAPLNEPTGHIDNAPCAFPDKDRADDNFIKRVVAGPGDTLAIVGGHVILNGKRQKDGFIRPCAQDTPCDYPKPITIPPGHWFMMGDNRGESEDSRFWGPIPKKWVIGGAFATYWPINRIGLL
jgi:signal peptidase I